MCVSETEIELCAGRSLSLRGVCVSAIQICRADMQWLSEKPRGLISITGGLLMLYLCTRRYVARTRDFITAGGGKAYI